MPPKIKDIKTRRFIRPNMDPQKLQHFLAVYEHKNFGRAAKQTGVTQQAVSKSISKLEEVLSVPLFERGAFGAEPTIYADRLALRAKIIIAEADMAAAELAALRGAEDGYVRVGFGWSLMSRIAPETISQFRARRPRIGLSIVTGSSGDLFPKLLAGDLDFVVSAPPLEFEIDPSLDVRRLFVDRDGVVMGKHHPLSKKPKISLKDLSGYTWLVALSLSARWQQICSVFSSNGITPPTDIIDMDSTSLAKAMLMQGDYLCALSEELTANEIASGDFISVRLPEMPLDRYAILVERRGSSLQPAAAALRSVLLEICSTLYPTGEHDTI